MSHTESLFRALPIGSLHLMPIAGEVALFALNGALDVYLWQTLYKERVFHGCNDRAESELAGQAFLRYR